MKKMTKSEIAEAIKKYNMIGFKEKFYASGWYTAYTPVAVIGETEKSWRCVVVEMKQVGRNITSICPDGTGEAGWEIYKADATKIPDNPKFICVSKNKELVDTAEYSYDYGR